MSLYNGPPRPGARGGRGEFSWESVKADKDREFYLGHSVKATTGRWQKGKDVFWYTRDKSQNSAAMDELEEVKRRERELMDEALGLKPKRTRPVTAPSLDKQDMDKLFSKGDDDGPAAADEHRVKGLGFAMAGMGPTEPVRDTLAGTGLPPVGLPGDRGLMSLEQLQAMAKRDKQAQLKSKKEKKSKNDKKSRKEKKSSSSKHSKKRKEESHKGEENQKAAKRARHDSGSSSSSSSDEEDRSRGYRRGGKGRAEASAYERHPFAGSPEHLAHSGAHVSSLRGAQHDWELNHQGREHWHDGGRWDKGAGGPHRAQRREHDAGYGGSGGEARVRHGEPVREGRDANSRGGVEEHRRDAGRLGSEKRYEGYGRIGRGAGRSGRYGESETGDRAHGSKGGYDDRRDKGRGAGSRERFEDYRRAGRDMYGRERYEDDSRDAARQGRDYNWDERGAGSREGCEDHRRDEGRRPRHERGTPRLESPGLRYAY